MVIFKHSENDHTGWTRVSSLCQTGTLTPFSDSRVANAAVTGECGRRTAQKHEEETSRPFTDSPG